MSSSIASYNGPANEGTKKASSSSSDVPLGDQVDYLPLQAMPNLFQHYIPEEVRLTILKNIRSTLLYFWH